MVYNVIPRYISPTNYLTNYKPCSANFVAGGEILEKLDFSVKTLIKVFVTYNRFIIV